MSLIDARKYLCPVSVRCANENRDINIKFPAFFQFTESCHPVLTIDYKGNFLKWDIISVDCISKWRKFKKKEIFLILDILTNFCAFRFDRYNNRSWKSCIIEIHILLDFINSAWGSLPLYTRNFILRSFYKTPNFRIRNCDKSSCIHPTHIKIANRLRNLGDRKANGNVDIFMHG